MIYNYIFFHYSFDEHIKYDLPAMLNYALEESGQDQLSYVGHSQGTAMGFGGFSSMPELAVKVKLFVALAPVTNATYVNLREPSGYLLSVTKRKLEGMDPLSSLSSQH